MKEVAVHEARSRLSEILVEIEGGEQFTITRRGVPVARLVAASPARETAGRAVGAQKKHVMSVFAQLVRQRHGVVMEGSDKDWAGDGRD